MPHAVPPNDSSPRAFLRAAGVLSGALAFRSFPDGVLEAFQANALAEVQAAKPTADFDDAWGKGFMNGDAFLPLVYSTTR